MSVDDLISKHLTNTTAAWSNITIRHLLTHTSGIKNYTGLQGFELTEHLTQKRFIEALSSYKLDFAPGESFKYSNSGYSLLGYIIENVSGKNYWEFLRERILNPLDMRFTTDRNPRIIITNRVSGYEQTNKLHINRDYDLTDVFSAGAIATTIGDLSRWNAAMDSTRILNAETKLQMWSPVKLNSGKTANYGFGWFLDSVEGHRCIGHGGSTSGFSASIQRFPDDGIQVLLLTNTDEMIATLLARKVAALYF